MFKAPELLYELNDTGATAILCLDQVYNTVAEVLGQTSIRHVIVTSLSDMAPATPAFPAPATVLAPRREIAGTIDMMPALRATPGPFVPPEPVSLDDVAALNYTGGTTGMPKGCIHTQRDMVYTAATTVPNMVRGTVVGMTTLFATFKDSFSVIQAGALVGVICFAIGIFCILTIPETHGRDLDFLEE